MAGNILKVPPHSIGTEKSVLGSMILSSAALIDGISILTKEDFYLGRHQGIFQIMADLHDDGYPVDSVTVSDKLESIADKTDTFDYSIEVMELVESAASVRDIIPHSKILRKFGALRRLITQSQEMQEKAFDPDNDPEDIISEAQKIILNIDTGLSQGKYVKMSDVLPGTFQDIEAYARGEITGIKSGFSELDELTSGFHPGDLIILAGRPGMFKTGIAMHMAMYASGMGKTALVHELEMPARQLTLRALCSEARVNMHILRLGKLPKSDFPKLQLAATPIASKKLYVDDSPFVTPSQIAATARRMKKEIGLDIMVVDYLQLMNSGTKSTSREQQVSAISRALKTTAKELEIPIIALSQLSRACEQRENKRPQLLDLRESGAIEQDADTVLFCYRSDYYNKDDDPNTIEIIIGKQRNGPTGIVKLGVEKETFTFYPLSKMEEPDDTKAWWKE